MSKENMIRGQKWGSVDGARVLITLNIPHNSQNNIGRPGIQNPLMASYMTDRAFVVSIEDNGTQQKEALSLRWPERLRQVVGQEVVDTEYNQPQGPRGIHFYLSKERLPYNYNIQNGLNKIYADNGWLCTEYSMKDGEILFTTFKTYTRYEGESDKSDFEVNPYKKIAVGI